MKHRNPEQILQILEAFLDQYEEIGIFFPRFREMVADRAQALIAHPDSHYMPDYKLTTLMADLVNLAASISTSGWLSDNEALEELIIALEPSSPLVRHYLADAGMERARYEPLMLDKAYMSPLDERNAILRIRATRMLEVLQTYTPVPDVVLALLSDTVTRVIESESFRYYRAGPMLQLFAEMIARASQQADRISEPDALLLKLAFELSDRGVLWRRFAAKSSRFSAPEGDPLRTGMFSGAKTAWPTTSDSPEDRILH